VGEWFRRGVGSAEGPYDVNVKSPEYAVLPSSEIIKIW